MFAPIPLDDCRITRRYLLDRENISAGTVIVCAVPYLSREILNGRNISAYCAVRDYHVFFERLFSKALPKLKEAFKGNRFAGFADHSPIDERDAAARAGLGVIGMNGMLITENYSSYVFLGEIITDAVIDCHAAKPRFCEKCGACLKACPRDELGQCLSALTQKKGELTEAEAAAITSYSTAWGCDICQEVCPHTKRAIASGSIFTKLDYFSSSVTPYLTKELIDGMSEEYFLSRAYSWRGRQTIIRNLEILNGKKS